MLAEGTRNDHPARRKRDFVTRENYGLNGSSVLQDLRDLAGLLAGVCAVVLLSHPAQKGQLTTAHIIDIRPRKTKLLPKPGLSPGPCKQRRRSASRLRSRAVKLHGFRTSACCRHEDLEKP